MTSPNLYRGGRSMSGPFVGAPASRSREGLPWARHAFRLAAGIALTVAMGMGSAAANVSYVGAGTASDTTAYASTVNPTLPTNPASWAQGDLLLVVAHYFGTAGVTIAVPAGYTQIGTNTADTTYGTLAVFYKIAGATESPPAVSTVPSTTGKFTAQMFAFRGVDRVSPIDVAGSITNQAAALTWTGAPVTTSATNAMVLFAGGSRDDNTWGTWGGGVSAGVYTANAASTNDNSVFLAYDADGLSTPGLQAAPTATQLTLGADAGRWLVFALAPVLPEGDATPNSTKPVLSIINPIQGAVLGTRFKVQARVFSPGGDPIDGVTLFYNAASVAMVRNAAYGSAADSGVFEAEFNPLAAGTYTLRAQATNSPPPTSTAQSSYSRSLDVTVVDPATKKGDGNLLVRDNSSQLCSDCHAGIETHSAETTDTGYGSWSLACRDCHTPHSTRNLSLIAESIAPPQVQQPLGTVPITFYNRSPGTNGVGATSYVVNSGATRTGICEVCHTQTKYFRRDASGAAHPAYTGKCGGCHKHTAGLAASCTGCHGDATNTRSTFSATAPPVDTCGNTNPTGGTTPNRVGAHEAHLVAGTFTGAIACAQCHVESPTRPEHGGATCTGTDQTNGRALLTWGALATGAVDAWSAPPVTPTYNYAGQSCSNVYCHGRFPNGLNATPTWGGTVTCGSCHDIPPMAVAAHATVTTTCTPCHSAGYSSTTVNPAEHIDGQLQASGFCYSCHGTEARSAQQASVWGGGETGAILGGAPPVPSAGRTANQTGPHLAHVYPASGAAQVIPPVLCSECHPNIATYDGGNHLTDLASDVGFGAAIRSTLLTQPASWAFGGNYPTDAGTCTSNYCHGSALPAAAKGAILTWTWDTTTNADCGSCHGLAPGTPWHTSVADLRTACNACHSPTIDASGNILSAVNGPFGTQHIDGTVDTAGITCTSCHGTNGRASNGVADPTYQPSAPPFSTTGSSLVSDVHVGAHLEHVNGTRSRQVACTECHFTETPGTTAWAHANGSTTINTANFGTLAKTGAVSPTYSGGATPTCSATYCHGNFTGGNGAGATPQWTTAVTLTCGQCHPSPVVSNRHTKHVTTYAYTCDECHASTMADNSSATIGTSANHVNGTKDWSFSTTALAAAYDQSGGTFTGGAAGTCSNTYCHSNGQNRVAPFTSGPSLAWNATAPADCTGCHGGATGAASVISSGSHTAHISTPNGYACAVCHSTVAATNTSIVSPTGFPLHVDGTPTVAMQATYGGTYSLVSKQCSNVSCHGTATPTWGNATSVTCRSCHGVAGTAARDDVQNWTFASPLGSGIVGATNPMSKIDIGDWTNYGHGRTAALGNYAQSNNVSAQFDGVTSGMTPTQNGCNYCHALLTNADHDTTMATNPFRLVSTSPKNQVCLNCHDPSVTGSWAPAGSGLTAITTVSKISATHAGGDHAATDAGNFCWDCHEPHGDYRYTATASPIAFMFQEFPTTANSGAGGWGIPTATAAAVDFRFNKDGSGSAGVFSWGDYAVASPYDGVCQVCHTGTSRFLSNGTTWASADPDNGHNTGQSCTATCHKHEQTPNEAFKGDLGNCRGCHGTATAGASPIRRAVDADFSKNSHHVGAGSATMGGALTNYDCIVCHAEGTATGKGGTISGNSTLHGNKRIDLRDADSTTTYYQYDTDTIRLLTLVNASSITASWRSEMSGRSDNLVGAPNVACNPVGANCLKGLDRFCISCHDADGATQSQNVGESVSATALNPFADTVVTNENDQQDRTRVTDIASRVHNTARTAAGGSATAANRDYTTAAATNYKTRRVDGGTVVNDPPEGVFSRHAIRGLSLSVYSATNANLDSATYWTNTTNWNSTTVMGCADCHTTDGRNSSSTPASNYGNAHGSNTEYLLKNNDGGATAEATTNTTYVCAKCHVSSMYAGGNGLHTPKSADWADTSADQGAARLGGDGNIYGYACGNCHGGNAPSRSGATAPYGDVTMVGGWGTIHGTSQVIGYGTGGATGYRPAYRFTNGNSMRYYDPGDWTTTATRTCYTLAGTGDGWGGCTQHDTGTANPVKTGGTRPLDY